MVEINMLYIVVIYNNIFIVIISLTQLIISVFVENSYNEKVVIGACVNICIVVVIVIAYIKIYIKKIVSNSLVFLATEYFVFMLTMMMNVTMIINLYGQLNSIPTCYKNSMILNCTKEINV